MPAYVFTSPDGRKVKVNAPDGATQEQAFAIAQQQLGERQSAPRAFNPFANNESSLPALPGEGTFDAFEKGAARPGYLSRVDEAFGALNNAKPTGGAGTVEALASLITGGVAAPVLGTAESIALGTPPEESFDRYTYQPRTESGKAQLGLLGEIVSPITESGTDIALAPLAAQSRIIGRPAKIAPNARYSARGAGSVPDRPLVVGEAVDARKAGSVPETQARSAGLEGVSKATPTIEELGTAATAAYDRAKKSGIVLSPESFGGAATKLRKTLETEGFHPRLHPKASVALEEIESAATRQEPMALGEIDRLRRIARSAQKSTEPDERRIAAAIIDEIDDYVDALGATDVVAGDPAKAAALKEARGLYARKAKAEEIHQLIENAELSAPNFSASGMENALRTEFRNLAKNQKRMRRFTAEEQAAIRKVAQGGAVENGLRMLGKFAPTGIVSTGISSGLGLLSGGPFGAVALPAAGAASRLAATKLTSRNARLAEELMRRGPRSEKLTKREASKSRALAEALKRQRAN